MYEHNRITMKYQFEESPFTQAETSISIKEITKCQECMSEEVLCWFHAKSLQSSIVSDVQNWIKDCKVIQEKDNSEHQK